MMNMGLKRILMISIMFLVAISVSAASTIAYFQQKNALTNDIIKQSRDYVDGMGKVIETMINEKVGGISKISENFLNTGINGTTVEIIALTKLIAAAMNSDSAIVAFDNGDGYWNQTDSHWPDHKYKGNVTERPWYKNALATSNVTVTEPYLGTDGTYWITIIKKIKGGIVSADLKLSFLNQLVKPSDEMQDAVVVILNQDTTLLASSSKLVETGKTATSYNWFKDAALNVVSNNKTMIEYQVNGIDKILFSQRINIGDKKWYVVVGLEKDTVFAALKTARQHAIIVTVISTIICVLIAFAVINFLYRPIISLRQMVSNLSSGNGDLTQRLKVTTNDDIGEICKGINTFIANLQGMMCEVKNSTEVLHSNVRQLKVLADNNSDMLNSHVQETEQIATAIEEMDATANSMASDAANTAKLTDDANQTSAESKKIVAKSQKAVKALIADVEQAAKYVQEMNTHTTGISTVLNVIGKIAEQTNLLALNAAIEAARAGEQGRGFAVVADEVRELANRTKDSTAEIEQAIENLLSGSQQVVNSMDETKKRCQETAVESDAVANSLDSLIVFINHINDLSGQIATAAEEQSCVTKEVSHNMNTISGIVSELKNVGLASSANAADIEKVNGQLVTIVNKFKL